jgi:hypothetical protein
MSKEGEPQSETFGPADDVHGPREELDLSHPSIERDAPASLVLEQMIDGIKSGELLEAWAQLPYLKRERMRAIIGLFEEACGALNTDGDIESFVLTSLVPGLTWKRQTVYDRPDTMQEFMDVRTTMIDTAETIRAEGRLHDDRFP